MLNEVLILQILSISTLFYFITAINIMTLWYLAGIYLATLGLLLLLDDGGVFIGFLWVIDLGVGLIFFIFILHFSNFLYQKTIFNFTFKNCFHIILHILIFILFYFYFATPVNQNYNQILSKTWFFFLTWYDYYGLYFARTVTDLNLLRELYFYNNSFEFFIVNFMIFYGIFGAINLTFLIRKTFNYLTFSQFVNLNLLQESDSVLFIRNQNFIKQQNTSVGTRVWFKNKNFKI